ncbi:DUF6706 family protein [Pedobacter metabolipauper]|uniref:Uncharacterized protein n=1 Tax=Pedobacter metabolipauper TaxID=425513 RepID=A0A4R6T0A9_9SPHI|nr:DUF6706 family protein [Pedobacter metabolipauper]TDQ12166.1 hypothetical protein ATK78_1298 [Pedobacter metabolipauper]
MALTIKSALQGKINYPLPDESLEAALIEASLDGDQVYSKSHTKDVELCAAGLILVVCTSGNVSEGGYSLSLSDKNALLKVRSMFLNKWNETDIDPGKPKISAVKGKW